MRIRTVKPEFWGHPVISKLDALTRLLAIALLNYSDDEGYFYADEELIRGALFPREDSTNVRRSLDELSRIGFVDLRESPSHGQIGHIVSFLKHQRVDRGKPSTLRGLHSSIDRRTIDERSTLEGKGSEGIGRESTPKAPKGAAVMSPEFLEFWQGVPNMIGKQAAWEAWQKTMKRGVKPAEILAGLPTYRAYEAKRKASSADYRPLHPATWLNGGRWEDRIDTETRSSGGLPDLAAEVERQRRACAAANASQGPSGYQDSGPKPKPHTSERRAS